MLLLLLLLLLLLVPPEPPGQRVPCAAWRAFWNAAHFLPGRWRRCNELSEGKRRRVVVRPVGHGRCERAPEAVLVHGRGNVGA